MDGSPCPEESAATRGDIGSPKVHVVLASLLKEFNDKIPGFCFD